jgi:hypothetical protein
MFEKIIKESFNSHLKFARKTLSERRQSKDKFIKFGLFDFDETLYSKEGEVFLEGTEAFEKFESCFLDPEPCYISIVTARSSNSRAFIESKIKSNFSYLFEDFKGKFTIETVSDKSPEDNPSVYDIARLKGETVYNIIKNNSDNLQETLVYFYDDIPENVESVKKYVDSLNVKTDNIINV